MMKSNHTFHIMPYSPWPIIMSMNVMLFMFSLIIFFYKFNYMMMTYSTILMMMTLNFWWMDTITESTYQGCHTKKVMMGIQMGMILFIISEIMFFISFFWTFMHNYLSPSIEIGMMWPPKSITLLLPMKMPLLNTCILLYSGLILTISHYMLMNNKKLLTLINLLNTIMWAIWFNLNQFTEFNETSFSMTDSIFGSIFFMMVGFHGLHVIVGTIFLMTMFNRMLFNHFSPSHHLGFETSIWYWHFVDIVWIALFILVYWLPF